MQYKICLLGKFITLNAYVRKQEKSQNLEGSKFGPQYWKIKKIKLKRMK